MKLQLLDHVEINGVSQPEGMIVELENEQAQPLISLGAAKEASKNAKVGQVVKPRAEDDDDAAAKKAEAVVAEATAKAEEIVSDAEKRAEEIVAEAEAKAEEVVAEAEKQAAEQKDPEESVQTQPQGQGNLKAVPQKDK